MGEIGIFGIRIHPLSKVDFLSIIESNMENGYQIVQSGINAASIVEIVNNEQFRMAIRNSNLVNVDGMSVVWALRFLGYRIPERVPCPDLAESILTLANSRHYSVFLLGAKEPCLLSCRKNLEARYPNLRIVGLHNGYFKDEDELKIVNMINKEKPDILLLGMPSPKKELFINKTKNLIYVKYCLGVGGFFDILSGSKKRAPVWMQRIGMEWFYRFIQEPRRMWKRYLIGNTLFIWLVIKEKFKLNKA